MNTVYNFTLNTKNRPKVLKLKIDNPHGAEIYFQAEDADNPHTFYFDRGKRIRRSEVVEFPMPLTPNNLKVRVYSKGNKPFIISGRKLENLNITPFPIDSYAKGLIDFLSAFVEQAGYIDTGVYISDDEKYTVMYMPTIDNRTPARVNRKTGLIKISQKDFLKMTVPMRFFVVMHEMCHHIVPTKSEIKADNCGLNYYLKLGFPQTEANFAMTKVFNENHFTKMRVENMIQKVALHDKSVAKRLNGYV